MGAPDRPPLDLVGALAALLACQLAGEVAVQLLRLPFPAIAFPGPVVGMALMFLYLLLRRGPGAGLETASTTILRNLSLLFVPAAVGVVQHGQVLADFGLALAAALVLSTVLTLVVTVWVFLLAARLTRGSHADQD